MPLFISLIGLLRNQSTFTVKSLEHSLRIWCWAEAHGLRGRCIHHIEELLVVVYKGTVDGQNPAPPRIMIIPLFVNPR